MRNLYKNIIAYAMAFLLVVPVLAVATQVGAAAGDLDPWGGKKDNIQSSTGLGDKDPRDIAAAVIKVVLGFLGIVAVVIILLGGFKWMTAAGNEDKVEEAKKLISAGIIGLIIILAAFGIATFVISSLMSATV